MNDNIHYNAVLGSLIAALPDTPIRSALTIAVTEGYRNGEPKWLDAMEACLWEAELGHADFHHQLFKSSLKDDGGFDEWFNRLWAEYPKHQHDGTTAPHRSKKVCLDRFRATVKKHRRSPEQIVRAIAAYVTDCMENHQWFASLNTVLGPGELWSDYIVEPRIEQQ